MGINLLDIQPHVVSKDLSGYITYIYGAAKTGKTTLASQMPDALLLAFERGYNAIPGIRAQDITTWGEMKQVFRELKKPEVKAFYKSIIIDTVDIAASLCEKYICNQNSIDALGELGYGKGWTAFKKEFEDVFRGLSQLGYAVFFISHDKEVADTDDKGNEIITIRPSLSSSSRSVIENMADLYGYAKAFRQDDGTSKVKLMLRSADGRVACGCRFKYIEPIIDFNYEALTKALYDAIDKEAQLNNNKFVTNEREAVSIMATYDYDALRAEFEAVVGTLIEKDANYYAPRLTQIIEKYLGKGKKVSDTTRDQAEFISLILDEIKEELMK